MGEVGLNLPIVDLSSPDRSSLAGSIRQACMDSGFFYVVNHGLDKDCLSLVLDETKRFFSLPLEEKMKIHEKGFTGYGPLYSCKMDRSQAKGDSRESFCIGRLDDKTYNLNQWPSEELLPNWRPTIEGYYRKVMSAARRLLSLTAMALNLDGNYFDKVGALDNPMAFLRIMHYPGDSSDCNEEVMGLSAHTDYGIMALLATDGVPGLQVCRDKDQQPRIWEDIPHVEGALIVNIGDVIERWTNGLFKSALHRVEAIGQERYSAAFFLNTPQDFLVKCLESCCSESNPPRFPPIRSVDYLRERFRLSHEL